MKKDRTLNMFAVVAPGLEAVCARELAALELPGAVAGPGGVAFSGTLRDLYRANLQLRTASRVVVRLGTFRCRSFPELFRQAQNLPWGQLVRPETSLQLRVTSRASRLFHTGRVAETVRAAADRALGRPAERNAAGEQLVLVRLQDDRCQISVDSSGPLLHRRGYRLQGAAAPLRETLAAGLLLLCGWRPDQALVDPLCGSGTLPIEAALLAANRPPGRDRAFAFMAWPGYRPGLRAALQAEADRHVRPVTVPIRGSDRDPSVIAAAQDNAARAGLAEVIEFAAADLAAARLPPGPGLVLCNPPYGERLGGREDLLALFARLGEFCRSGGPGWRCCFLAPEERLSRATGLSVRPLAALDNGGLALTLFGSNPGG